MKYMYMTEKEQELPYYQFPKFLLEMKLSQNARMIYMLLYDRFRLSQKNGWANERDEVYLVYPRQELAETLQMGRKRITAAMRELAEHALLWEQNGGYSVANQIYLAWGGPVDISEDNLSISCEKSELPF